MESSRCTVIHKESATGYIVELEDGTKVNIETSLPDVDVGIRGMLLTMGGRTQFIREPYSD